MFVEGSTDEMWQGMGLRAPDQLPVCEGLLPRNPLRLINDSDFWGKNPIDHFPQDVMLAKQACVPTSTY